MSRLAPDLFQRRFGDLVRIGRSRLPSYAPAWTDHNAHDPGITLVELLAFVAEAEIYSLARGRRDERRAYAALIGVAPAGPRPARGLIWPDHDDPDSPAATLSQATILATDRAIHLEKSEQPSFRAAHRMLWIPARIEALTSRLADGTVVDHLTANRRGGPVFQPFGEDEELGGILRMVLSATGHAPLFEPGRPDDARLLIGVRADAPRGAAADDRAGGGRPSPLEVTLAADGVRVRLPVVEDTSHGLLRSGVVVLDLSGVDAAPRSATLEFRAPRGLDRAPRIRRIEPNVLPVVQRLEISERHRIDGLPDRGFDLETPGLEFEPGSVPVRVEVERPAGAEAWRRCERLADCGPADRVYELDPVAARITFGNGVNGAIPPADTPILVSYRVSEGKGGNLAANRKWVVPGVSGMFGTNPDPTSGGEDPSGWLEQRREARRAVREDHGLVNAADFERAARALPELEVGRAWMMPPSPGDAATGTMRLVAMRARLSGAEPEAVPETARWLEAVRTRLAPRTPLGSRLVVVAPRYVGFAVRARVEAEPKKDPAEVRRSLMDELARRLILVSATPGVPQRPFGLPVTRRDVAAWIQALPDVRRVRELSIRPTGGSPVEQVELPRSGLPRIDLARSDILVVRAGGGDG